MRKIVVSLLLMGVTFVSALASTLQPAPQLNKTNIDAVIKAMTLEEKASLVVGAPRRKGSPDGSFIFNADSTRRFILGSAGWTTAIPRLGIPSIILADGPTGLRIEPDQGDGQKYYCTAMPVGIAMASSWDRDLVGRMSAAIGDETDAYGVDILLAPGMNIQRNPLCGRNFEYFSEDPVLSGEIGAAYINGVQSQGVGVSMKHFAANNQETHRLVVDAQVDPQTLHEIYLRNFEICLSKSTPWTVMSSYNRLNGVLTQEDPQLLTGILRGQWHYPGLVMTDWTGRRNTALQIEAGNDLMMSGSPKQLQDVVDAVKDGSLDEAVLDRAVRRVLELVVKTHSFARYQAEHSALKSGKAVQVVPFQIRDPDLKAHAALSREAAAECMVLLKNDAVLPLSSTDFGSTSAKPFSIALYGVRSYDLVAGGTGAADVNKAYVSNLCDALQSPVQIDQQVSSLYKDYLGFIKTDWQYNDPGNARFYPELEISKSFIDKRVASNDVAIITIGRNAGENRDRLVEGDFDLTGIEQSLIRNVCDAYHAAGKKVIVVINAGGVIETASWKDLPDAVLLAWQPGQEGGNAIADVLFGKACPSGKLPVTFPVDYSDILGSADFPYDYTGESSNNGSVQVDLTKPQVRNVDYTVYSEGRLVGYRYFTTENVAVSYPFGFGLSYTRFAYSAPTVKTDRHGNVTASVTVTNTGSVAGKEIVEVYVSREDGVQVSEGTPELELKAFDKTASLAAGQSQTLTFKIERHLLDSYSPSKAQWVPAKGRFTLFFSASANDPRQSAGFILK